MNFCQKELICITTDDIRRYLLYYEKYKELLVLLQPNNTSKKEKSDMEVSRFVSHGQADDEPGTHPALRQHCRPNSEAVGEKQPLNGVFKHAGCLWVKKRKLTGIQDEPVDDSAYSCAPFISEGQDHDVSRTADVTGLVYGAAGTEPQESSLQPFQDRPNDGLRTGETAVAEPSNLRPSYNNLNAG